MKQLNKIRILGLGIVASVFLTGCTGGVGTDYSKYGLDADSSKNRVIESKTVSVTTPEEVKIYTEANERILKRLLAKQVKQGYEYLGNLTPEQVYDLDGKPLMDIDGKPLMSKKGGYMNNIVVTEKSGSTHYYNDNVKAQSFKVLRDQVGSQKGVTFSTERVETREMERTAWNGGNTNGSMQTVKSKGEVISKITYTLSPVATEDGKGLHGLKQTVSSKCYAKSSTGTNEISCSKNIFHFQDMMDLVVDMKTILEKNYASEMELEISKTDLKFK